MSARYASFAQARLALNLVHSSSPCMQGICTNWLVGREVIRAHLKARVPHERLPLRLACENRQSDNGGDPYEDHPGLQSSLPANLPQNDPRKHSHFA